MTRFRQLQLIGGLVLALAVNAAAQSLALPEKSVPIATNLLPPLPQTQSPVVFFRQLLAMSVPERNIALTNRAPESRSRILAKVKEYQQLPPDERELRLKATELRWWLTPLLRLAPAERTAREAAVPAEFQALVKARLQQWDLLPPQLQKEFLANDRTLQYFARVETTNQPPAPAVSAAIAEQVNRFFELTAAEKVQTLKTLSSAERAQMEKTLQTFEKLPPQQRLQCVRNYAKFVGMTPPERAEFLKNAESWAKMSPQERQTWRDLVTHVPLWPPMPTPVVPHNLIPPNPAKTPRPSVATNLN